MAWPKRVLTGFGGPACLEARAVETLPEPQGSEGRIRGLVTGAAFPDVMIRKGMYPDVTEKPPFPRL
ncbi:MAG: hypothetical protein R6V26_09980 [Roseovarius sp.]